MALVFVLKPFCFRACSFIVLMKRPTRCMTADSGGYSSVSSMHRSRKMNSNMSYLSYTLKV